MPVYSYKAKNMMGQTLDGTLEVESKVEVYEFLDKQEYFPVDIKEVHESTDVLNIMKRFERVKPEEITNFTKQLSTLLGAGVPIVSALESLQEQNENEKFKGILKEIIADVSGGSSFSESLLKHQEVFSELYVNMVLAGESAGVLEGVLGRLSSFMDHDQAVRKSIKSAMRYPIIVFTALMIAFFFAVTFIIPKFALMFTRSGVELPIITRILLSLNLIITDYWYFGLSGLILVVYSIRKYLSSTAGRLMWDRFKLKLPAFGPIFGKNSISRFCHMLETLNMSGIHIIQALEICAKTSGNAAVGLEITKAKDNVVTGVNLADALDEGSLFPPMTIRMIRTGVESGSLDSMLQSIYEQYDEDVDYLTKRLSAMVEPMMTVIIGVFILILALGIFLPMWNMYETVQ